MGKRRGVVRSAALDAGFGALAHPTRRQIAAILAARDGHMTAGEIADRFKHAWPTTTRHLGVLRDAGVLKVETRGRERLYTLQPEALLALADWLIALAATEAGPLDREQWSTLPYASMRNAMKPGGDRGAR